MVKAAGSYSASSFIIQKQNLTTGKPKITTGIIMIKNKPGINISKCFVAYIALACITVAAIVQPAYGQDTIPPAGNPIIKNIYTADPAALVYNGTVYLYTGHDEAPPKREGYIMHDWLCYSSTDMVNWKEHDIPLGGKRLCMGKRRCMGIAGNPSQRQILLVCCRYA